MADPVRGAASKGKGWKHTEESRRKMSEAQKRRHENADQPPRSAKSGAQKRSENRSAELRLIREGFAELLALPAIGAALKGDQWAVDHFSTRGPALADRIAAECERNEQLRRICLRALKAQGMTMLAVEAFMYAVPALMHYGLVPGAEGMGVPVLTKSKQQPAAPGPEWQRAEKKARQAQQARAVEEAEVQAAREAEVQAARGAEAGAQQNGSADPLEAELAEPTLPVEPL